MWPEVIFFLLSASRLTDTAPPRISLNLAKKITSGTQGMTLTASIVKCADHVWPWVDNIVCPQCTMGSMQIPPLFRVETVNLHLTGTVNRNSISEHQQFPWAITRLFCSLWWGLCQDKSKTVSTRRYNDKISLKVNLLFALNQTAIKPCLSTFVKHDRVPQTLFNLLLKLLLPTIHQEQYASSYILISSTKNAW